MEVKPIEIKKVATSTPKIKDRENSLMMGKSVEFIGEVKEELQKISWTSGEDLKTYTQIVVGSTFFFGMGIYLLDLFIQSVLNSLAFAIRLIAG